MNSRSAGMTERKRIEAAHGDAALASTAMLSSDAFVSSPPEKRYMDHTSSVTEENPSSTPPAKRGQGHPAPDCGFCMTTWRCERRTVGIGHRAWRSKPFTWVGVGIGWGAKCLRQSDAVFLDDAAVKHTDGLAFVVYWRQHTELTDCRREHGESSSPIADPSAIVRLQFTAAFTAPQSSKRIVPHTTQSPRI